MNVACTNRMLVLGGKIVEVFGGSCTIEDPGPHLYGIGFYWIGLIKGMTYGVFILFSERDLSEVNALAFVDVRIHHAVYQIVEEHRLRSQLKT